MAKDFEEIDKREYLVYCDEDGEWEEVTGKKEAVKAARQMLEEYKDYNDIEDIDDVVVGIWKLDTEVRLVMQAKHTLKEEVFTNGIRK